MAIDKSLILTLSYEVGIIAISTISTFLTPGLGGLIISGVIQILGDLGLEFATGGIPNNIMWYLTEFLTAFSPYFKELKEAKVESNILRKTESALAFVEEKLQKVDDFLFDSIEKLKVTVGKQFKPSSGLTEDLEEEVKLIEAQEVAREKFQSSEAKIKVKKKVSSFTPNTKNVDSWIAGVGFEERARFGPRDIRGDLVIVYYVNNAHRVGYALKPIEKIVLGRTSAGETVSGGKNNKDRYRKVEIKKDISKGKMTRKVVFKGAKYFSDYLGFCKAGSWGGYYMRRWMVGLPGRKEQVNSLVLFGSLWRVYSKIKALSGDAKDVIFNSKDYFTGKGKEYFGQTQFGSSYNKVTDVFSKSNNLKNNPIQTSGDVFKSKFEQRRDFSRENNLHKKRR